ncbi:MAG TPA: ABC transporter ATP-binding protein, partial [Trueperaceae bacterium]|nr:ABC transporter ATP-binding protein [Trueperaceae bacterium]
MKEVDLKLVRLRKEFASPDGGPGIVAVDDVELQIEKGALVTLLGPSGCGKTTLLRMIAGFEEPTSGEVWFADRRVDRLAPNSRDTAMVFQSYAIFPHLNVYENVAFGLRMQRVAKATLERRVDEVLDLVGLTSMAQRAPSQLSGGQQQRVALARCIVLEPHVLLFDEPLSNLDAKLRDQMRVEIRELQQRLGITSVYVTHDQVEAMALSDIVVVMNRGAIEQVSHPREIYARPVNRFVADFIGKANFLEGTVVDDQRVRVAGKVLPLSATVPYAAGTKVTLVARPEALALTSEGEGFAGTILRSVFLGDHAEYLVAVPGVGDLQIASYNPAAVGMWEVGAGVRVATGKLH